MVSAIAILPQQVNVRYRTFGDTIPSMPTPEKIATIRTEIERLEKALRECSDSGIRKVIEDWIAEARKKLASSQRSQ